MAGHQRTFDSLLTEDPSDPREVPLIDGSARLWREWLAEIEANSLFAQLRDELAWEQSIIRTYGREHPIPRFNAWYGDPGAAYRYSGRTFEPRPWLPVLLKVKIMVEQTCGVAFNGMLANYYRDGQDSVSWHSDAEPELGTNPIIASVSLGAERKFTLKHRLRKDLAPVHLWLPSGSLLLMDGPTQHYWVHQLPKTTKPVGPRINLTFRLVR